ncbi:MAG: hypothetical protein QOE58_2018 [Actinomycetota bacterium]|jgi:hypothetical protein|nr:hypothetical protein [Actinomycetota bacterium]
MPTADQHAVKTYRYLRLAMIALVVGLGTSVVFEWTEQGRSCLKTSISAYYYTPVQAFFVSALVAIGVCLICLKGSTEWDDTLLNLAGAFAPVVALVPTPNAGACPEKAEQVVLRDPNVLNNVTALLVVGGLAILVTAILAGVDRRQGVSTERSSGIGMAVVVLVWVLTLVAFVSHRRWFTDNAHYTAAISMFACIVIVVSLNALGLGRRRRAQGEAQGKRAVVNRYLYIAIAMVASVIGALVWKWTSGFDHAVLFIEAALILLFATFWLAQTAELWAAGLREEPAAPETAIVT